MDIEDFTGQTIKGYQLREQIGFGGFGAVYRAYQASVDREVAIKIILPHHTQRKDFVRRFEIEARLIARLEHVHIVPLYDFWHEADGNAYIVMRYLKGGSLRAMLLRQPLAFDLMGRILRQIGDALALAHQNGIIHRDIKPDNILFDEQQNAYLSDFGIAKDLVSKVDLTATASTLGSPAYAAPEQFFGGEITPVTDIYSLGMTLFESLAGGHPFPDNHIQHLQKPIPSLRARRPDAPPALDAVLARATSKDPDGRYPNSAALAAAYDSVWDKMADGASRPVPARPGPAGEAEPPPDQAITTPGVGAPVPLTEDADLETLQLFGRTPIVTPRHPTENGEQSALLLTESRHLPARPFNLVGRDDLVGQINALIDNGQQILLHGMAGIGKTALVADIVARRLEANQGPVLWLRAGHQDAPALIEALMRPFDARLVVTPSNLQITPVRDLLDDHNIKLIVLDDVWNDDALQAVVDALPRDVPLVVTSRQRYALRRIVTVEELDLLASLNLLEEHAGADFSVDAAANNLCRLLGYHPFALELAGRTMQVDELTPAQLIQQLGGEPHRLGPLAGFGESGSRSVKELLETSIEFLDGATRNVLLAMGALFTPTCTPALIATILNHPVIDALTVLARRGLVRRDRLPHNEITIYRLHDLTHSYARASTHIDAPTVIAACRRYLDQPHDSLDGIDAERTNLLKAAEAAAAAADDASVVAILYSLTVTHDYLRARGHDALLRSTLDLAIEAAWRMGDDHREALHYLLGRRGDTHYERDELDEALALYDESLALARDLAIADREGVILCMIGRAHTNRQDFDAAEDALDAAALIAARIKDDNLTAQVFEVKGYLYAVVKKDFEAAHTVFEQQVRFAEQLDNTERLFYALLNLGSAEHDLAQLDAARATLERAQTLAVAQNNPAWLGLVTSNIGLLHDAADDKEQAQAIFDEALSHYRRAGLSSRISELTDFMREAGYAVSEEAEE